MNIPDRYAYLIPKLLFGTILFGFLTAYATAVWVKSHNPQVIVNMPANAQPLATLDKTVVADAKVIDNERAVLWWTVYKYSVDKGVDAGWARNYAGDAVLQAYGKAP